MQNPGFELGWTRQTHTGQEFGEIFVPEGWVAFWREGMPVPHDPQNQVGYRRPEMKVIERKPPFLSPLRIHEGNKAVQIFTFYGIHDAGIYQTFSVTPGARLRFSAWAHAWSSGADDAHYSDLSGDAVQNFTFTVGIDPTGGTDPWGDGVIWGAGAHIYDQYALIPVVEAVAQAETVTVFIRSTVLWPFKHCDAYIDAAQVEIVEEPIEALPYPVTVVLLPPDATLDEKYEAVRLTDLLKRTFMQSADDAWFLVTHGAVGSAVHVFGRSRWPGDIEAYLRGHGVVNIEFYEFESEPEPEPEPEPIPGPYIPYGSKLGIHTSMPAGTPEHAEARAQAGAPISLFKAVEDWGYLRLVKEWSPSTLTIARKLMPFDGAGGVQDWSPVQIQAYAAEYMAAYRSYLLQQAQYDDGKRLTYIDWLELFNEPDPPGVQGYANLARLAIEMLNIGETWDVPLKEFALFGLNAGTPEWDEMQAVAETGLLERIAQGGHILTLHEGVLPFSDPIDKYWPGSIPGAPAVERAGALCGRYRYWIHLARQRGLYLPIGISEFYSGPDYELGSAAQIVERMAWYDNLVAQDAEVLGFCPFTMGQGPPQDYGPFLPDFYTYAVSVKDRQNAGE